MPCNDSVTGQPCVTLNPGMVTDLPRAGHAVRNHKVADKLEPCTASSLHAARFKSGIEVIAVDEDLLPPAPERRMWANT